MAGSDDAILTAAELADIEALLQKRPGNWTVAGHHAYLAAYLPRAIATIRALAEAIQEREQVESHAESCELGECEYDGRLPDWDERLKAARGKVTTLARRVLGEGR